MFNEVNIRPNDVIRLNFNPNVMDVNSVIEMRNLYQKVFPNNIVVADYDTSITNIDIFHMEQADTLLSLDKDRIF